LKKKTCSIIITNATAVTNPVAIAFERIESMNPNRNRPPTKVKIPTKKASVCASSNLI